LPWLLPEWLLRTSLFSPRGLGITLPKPPPLPQGHTYHPPRMRMFGVGCRACNQSQSHLKSRRPIRPHPNCWSSGGITQRKAPNAKNILEGRAPILWLIRLQQELKPAQRRRHDVRNSECQAHTLPSPGFVESSCQHF
jgi:hypothetical protein